MNILMDLLIVIFLFVIFFKAKFTKDNKEYLSLKTCNSIRGVLALMVLFHHIAQKTTAGNYFPEFKYLGFMPVSLFFFFSGYGLMKKYMNDEDYSKGFIKKRIPTLLIPYVIVILLYWIMYACYGHFYTFAEMGEILSRGYIIASASWYIVDIIVLYFVFYLLMKLFKKKYNLIILGNFIFNILMILYFKRIDFGEYWYNTIIMCSVGMLWAYKEENIISFIKKSYYLILPMFLILFHILCHNRYLAVKVLDFEYGSVIVTLTLGLLFSVILIMLSRKIIIGNKILDFVGKISLEVYLLQGIFAYVFRTGYFAISNDFIKSLMIILFTFIFSFVFNKIFSFILSKYKKLIAS